MPARPGGAPGPQGAGPQGAAPRVAAKVSPLDLPLLRYAVPRLVLKTDGEGQLPPRLDQLPAIDLSPELDVGGGRRVGGGVEGAHLLHQGCLVDLASVTVEDLEAGI